MTAIVPVQRVWTPAKKSAILTPQLEAPTFVPPTPVSPRTPLVSPPRLRFGTNQQFYTELRQRVDAFFKAKGSKPRDNGRMYLKTGILMAGLITSYSLLVYCATEWWQALPLAILVGLSMAGIGFNVQHDGGHQAYSDKQWINRLMAMSLDLVGGSSYFWHWKHVSFHHTYVNVAGHDTDVDLGGLGRLTPHHKRHFFHRWQHIYLWPLYGFLAIKWEMFDDFRDLLTGRIGPHKIPRPKGMDLVIFFLGKITFFFFALALPMCYHPVGVVLAYYAIMVTVLGVVLSLTFQLAHCVEEAEFPIPAEGTDNIEATWAVHQVETTVDFARTNPVVAWFLGGLNFQIEHHLFPKICHVNYPEISKIVEQTCQEYGIKYHEHRTVWAGIVSHFRWLRQMGQPDAAAH